MTFLLDETRREEKKRVGKIREEQKGEEKISKTNVNTATLPLNCTLDEVFIVGGERAARP